MFSADQSLDRKFTHRLDGVSVDWEGLYASWEPTKEKLLELDSDVHLAAPAKVATDALADAVGSGYGEDGRNIVLDYELLLEADSDVLLVLGPMTALPRRRRSPVAAPNPRNRTELTAVQEGHIYTQAAGRDRC